MLIAFKVVLSIVIPILSFVAFVVTLGCLSALKDIVKRRLKNSKSKISVILRRAWATIDKLLEMLTILVFALLAMFCGYGIIRIVYDNLPF